MQTVSITLPNKTASVNVIVNGANYTFALTGSSSSGTIWSADVPRAPKDIYQCIITAVSDVGTSTTVEVTLFYGLLELITDRTRSDVDRAIDLSAKGLADMTAEELAEFEAGLKGAYNATDLNRVESAVQYLTERLTIAGVYRTLSTKNTWARQDYPVSTEMVRYLENIRALRSSFTLPADAPTVPEDMHRFTYQEANNIEKLLLIIDAIITNIALVWFYSGELHAGEV